MAIPERFEGAPALRPSIAIVGAGAGIGSTIARSYYDEDVDLYLAANTHYEELKEELQGRSGIFRAFRADLSLPGAAEELGDAILAALKEDQETDLPRLDAVVLAAGIDLMRAENKALSFDDRLAKSWRIDAASAANLARKLGGASAAYVRGSSSARPASVVMFGWSGVARGLEGETAQIYSLCKGAVVAFARSLAQELAPYARVNTVSPGWIKTTWGSTASSRASLRAEKESLAGRWGTAEEIAEVVRFLASDRSAFVNAQDVVVDGGRSYRF